MFKARVHSCFCAWDLDKSTVHESLSYGMSVSNPYTLRPESWLSLVIEYFFSFDGESPFRILCGLG